jgi:hypothetical protein
MVTKKPYRLPQDRSGQKSSQSAIIEPPESSLGLPEKLLAAKPQQKPDKRVD